MPYLKDVRDFLWIAYSENWISEEELIILLEENTSKNPPFSYKNYERFKLENIEDPECKSDFRVHKNDLVVLAEALQLPEKFICHQRTTADNIEGLSILLRRMAFPCRFSDMIPRFGRPVAELSMIYSEVLNFIYDAHGHKLTQWNHDLLNPQSLESYADAISSKGAALENCFGFIDGTVRPISRPSENQNIVYNGHKRVHSLKFQPMTIPNGLIANLYGPVGESTIFYIFICINFCILR